MAAKKESIFSDVDIRKLDTHTTAVGELVFGFISEPSTEYDERGQYVVRLRFHKESKEAKRLIKIILDAAQTAYDMAQERITSASERKKLKRAEPSCGIEEDEDGNETDYVFFNFKRKATFINKKGDEKTVKLPIFDGLGQPVDPEGLDVWGGSEVAVAFKLIPFYTAGVGVGVSHRLEAVQIVKAVSSGSRTAEEFGFAQHEGAFSASAAEDETDEAPDEDMGVASDEEDDAFDKAFDEKMKKDEAAAKRFANKKHRTPRSAAPDADEEGDY